MPTRRHELPSLRGRRAIGAQPDGVFVWCRQANVIEELVGRLGEEQDGVGLRRVDLEADVAADGLAERNEKGCARQAEVRLAEKRRRWRCAAALRVRVEV